MEKDTKTYTARVKVSVGANSDEKARKIILSELGETGLGGISIEEIWQEPKKY